ncbi:MAG TPA: hypothetical protein VGE29_21210 [Prosthecobacter sp.]
MTLTHDRHLQTGIAGSVAIHVLLLMLLAWGFGSQAAREFLKKEPAATEEEPEVTLIFPEQILVAPPPPQELPSRKILVNTSGNEAAATAPQNARFVSDKNTVAASILPPSATSSLAMPTLNGTAPGQPELTSQEYQAGKLQPAAAKPAPAEKKVAADTPERLPIEVRKPAPVEPPAKDAVSLQVRVPEDAPPPLMTTPSDDADFAAFRQVTKTEGTVSREGENAVDAAATPQAIYESKVKAAISQRWQESVNTAKLAVTGRLSFSFYLDKKGIPQDLVIHSDSREADPRMRELTLRAILDADIPPLPADLLPTLEGERMKIQYEVILY